MPIKPLPHPHQSAIRCACGEVITTYGIYPNCSDCTSNCKTSSSSTDYQIVLYYIDSDLDISVTIAVPFTLSVEHSEVYKKNGTTFVSFEAEVTSHTTGQSPTAPQIQLVADRVIEYKNASGSIGTQTLVWRGSDPNNVSARNNPAFAFTLQGIPTSVTSHVTCSLQDGIGISYKKSTTTTLIY